ncbi:MAG: TetR/AcrR family transcriptional regulator [Pseudomonadota bacterium]
MSKQVDTRSKIEASASAILREQGVEALTVRNIAARAGLSTMGVYSHFGGKDQVCEALFVAGFAELGERVEQAKSESNPRDAVLRSAAIYFDFFLANRHRYALMFGMNSSAAPPSERARDAAKASFEQWASVVSLLSGATKVGPEEVRLARQIWASTHGCIAIGEHSPIGTIDDVRQLALDSVAYLVDGYLAKNAK